MKQKQLDLALINKIERHYEAQLTGVTLLGAGNRGKVYLLTLNEEPYAICLKEDSDLERSEEEARLAEIAYDHKGVYWTTNTTAFYTMPFFRGNTLSSFNTARMGLSERAEIVLGISRQLENIHSKGILHRDIKPDNILIPPRRPGATTAIIIDFGRAVQINKRPTLGKLSLNKEKSFFRRLFRKISLFIERKVSPEHVQDDRNSICLKSDVFSLGRIVEKWLPELPQLKAGLLESDTQKRMSNRELTIYLEKFTAISKALPTINTSKSPLVDLLHLYLNDGHIHKISNKQLVSRFLATHYEVLKKELGLRPCQIMFAALNAHLNLRRSQDERQNAGAPSYVHESSGPSFFKRKVSNPPAQPIPDFLSDVVIRNFPVR